VWWCVFSRLQKLLPDAFILAIISFMLSFSVSKKYATQNRYEIDNSQELVSPSPHKLTIPKAILPHATVPVKRSPYVSTATFSIG
jgi:hypothetical protein